MNLHAPNLAKSITQLNLYEILEEFKIYSCELLLFMLKMYRNSIYYDFKNVLPLFGRKKKESKFAFTLRKGHVSFVQKVKNIFWYLSSVGRAQD